MFGYNSRYSGCKQKDFDLTCERMRLRKINTLNFIKSELFYKDLKELGLINDILITQIMMQQSYFNRCF